MDRVSLPGRGRGAGRERGGGWPGGGPPRGSLREKGGAALVSLRDGQIDR